MYYTYVLLSERDHRFYVGYSHDLKARFEQHQRGLVFATKSRLPTTLVFYEAYQHKYDALRREKYLKTTKGKTTLRSMLQEYLKERGM